MPIYEYRCDCCGEVHEALQRISDAPLTCCPSGDGGTLSKIMSVHSIGSSAPSAPAGCATPGMCSPQAQAMCGAGGGCGIG